MHREAEHQAEKGSTQPHGIFLPLPLSSLFWSFSPAFSLTSSPRRCLPLSPCRRLQNGTRLFPSQPAAVTQRRQPAAGAKSEPTLSFRMTHWNLALISLFLVVDGEQPKSYTGLDQGKWFKSLFYPKAAQRFEGAKLCTKAGTGTNSVGVWTPGITCHQCAFLVLTLCVPPSYTRGERQQVKIQPSDCIFSP